MGDNVSKPNHWSVEPLLNESTVDTGLYKARRSVITDSSGNIIGSDLHGSDYHLLMGTKDITGSGTLGALNSTVTVDTHGCGSGIIIASGTWQGKIEIQGSIDSVWATLSIVSPLGTISRNGIVNDTANGQYRIIIVSGYSKIRAVMTAYTSGTASVQMNFAIPVGTSYVWQLNQDNLNATVFQSPTAWVVADGVGTKIYDTIGGTYLGLNFHNGNPQVCSQDYLFAVAEGDITGHSSFSKYGRVSGVNNLLVDVWPGEGGTASVYAFPPSAIQMNVASTSASDDDGGTGINKIMIVGLDTNYAEQTEEVTLDGLNAVTTTKSFLRVNFCYATLAGTGGVAARNITVKNTANTITYSVILSGLTACRQLIYTVPAGKTLYLTSVVVGSGAGGNAIKLNAVTFTPKIRTFGSTVFLPAGELLSINTETVRPLESPAKISEKSDVKMSAQGDYDAGGTTCISAVRGVLE